MDKLIGQLTSRLTTRLARKKEILLKNAISYKIGNYDWDIADLTSQGEIKISPDGTEIFAFDGQDLIHFGHLRIEADNTVPGYGMKAIQEYRLLYL